MKKRRGRTLARYHDEEWGVPEYDSRALWEKLMSYNDHHPAPFNPSVFGWFAPPKFTRASEPALLWN